MSLTHIRRNGKGLTIAAAAALAALGALPLHSQRAEAQASLRGSRPSVDKMYYFAVNHHLPFMQSEAEIDSAAAKGELVPLTGNDSYVLSGGVGWAYVRPETRRFVETLAPQYEAICGAPLIITSATRPRDRQPRNSVAESVHPTGLAVDIRRPAPGPCLDWIRQALLALESHGYVEATEEHHPPHLHVAVLTPPGTVRNAPVIQIAGFTPHPPPAAATVAEAPVGSDALAAAATPAALTPAAWRFTGPRAAMRALSWWRYYDEPAALRVQTVAFTGAPTRPSRATLAAPTTAVVAVAPVVVRQSETAAGEVALPPKSAASGSTSATVASATKPESADTREYKVRPGDTLWDLSRRLKVPVQEIAAANHIQKNATLRVGSVLQVPDER